MEKINQVALVTGANRGIGLEIAKQLAVKNIKVILSARNRESGQGAVHTLNEQGFDVTFYPLDVTSESDIINVMKFIDKSFGRLDILINNAAILIDEQESALTIQTNMMRSVMESNLYGPLRLCQKVIPLMRKNKYGRIVNLSSGMGAFNEICGGYPSYRISKTALNAMTKILASELAGTNILVNSMCPGWVKTGMGGSNAPRTVAQGADTAVWLSLLPDGGPTGAFFRDRKQIAW